MSAEQAAVIARNLYGDHPAAAALMLEAIYGTTPERRERSRLALLCLDPDHPLDYLAPSAPQGPAWTAAQAIAYLLVARVSGTRQARARVASLFAALCSEAARLVDQEGAA